MESYLNSIEIANQIESDMLHVLFIPNNKAIATYEWMSNKEKYIIDFNNFFLQMSTIIQSTNPELIIFHSLSYKHDFSLIKKFSKEIKIGWSIWGWDLYSRLTSKDGINELVNINENISCVMGYEGDYDIYRHFIDNAKPNISKSNLSLYAVPTIIENKKLLLRRNKNILIGNSGDPGNNHFEIIGEIIKKIDYNDYKYIIPMSYGANDEYIEAVENLAKKNFLNYEIMQNFINPEEYANIVGASSGVITAHNRQQSAGTLVTAITNGVPVVLRSKININEILFENPLWKLFTGFSVNILEWNDFKKLNMMCDFVKAYSRKEETEQLLEMCYSEIGAAQRLINVTKEVLGHSSDESTQEPPKGIIFMTGRNYVDYIVQSLESLKNQKNNNFHILFVDDASTDRSEELAIELLNKNFKNNFTFIQNKEKQGKSKNAFDNLKGMSRRYDYCAILDPDDRLIDDAVLNIFEKCYLENHDVVWTNYITDTGLVGNNNILNKEISPRNQKWLTSHFFSFRLSLFDNITEDYFKDGDGNWFMAACDFSIAYPILDQTRRYKYIERNSYLYTATNPISHHNQDQNSIGLNSGIQSKNAGIILNKKPLECRRH
jgi:hypothetical protein